MSYANVSQAAIDSLLGYVSRHFTQLKSEVAGSPAVGAVNMNLNSTAPVQAGAFAPQSMQAIWSADSNQNAFNALATSITNNIRVSADDQTKIIGRTGTYVTLIGVRWAWITLPVICVLLGTASLIVSIRQTKQQKIPIWKNSALALSSHGLDPYASGSLGNDVLISETDRKARKVSVKLNDELKLSALEDNQPMLSIRKGSVSDVGLPSLNVSPALENDDREDNDLQDRESNDFRNASHSDDGYLEVPTTQNLMTGKALEATASRRWEASMS